MPIIALLPPHFMRADRRNVGLSQEAVAARMAVSTRHYQRWEAGSHLLRNEALIRRFLSIIAEERERQEALAAEIRTFHRDLLPLVS